MRRAQELRAALEVVLEGNERNMVYWWERRGRGVFMQATPIDVSKLLRERLFEQVETVILTSATLRWAERSISSSAGWESRTPKNVFSTPTLITLTSPCSIPPYIYLTRASRILRAWRRKKSCKW